METIVNLCDFYLFHLWRILLGGIDWSSHTVRSRTQTHNIQLQDEQGKFFIDMRSHSFQNLKSTAVFLRTVPTIVGVHTFCASRKTWLKCALGLTLTQSTTLLMKAKFSYCDQIKFNEPVLTRNTRIAAFH